MKVFAVGKHVRVLTHAYLQPPSETTVVDYCSAYQWNPVLYSSPHHPLYLHLKCCFSFRGSCSIM